MTLRWTLSFIIVAMMQLHCSTDSKIEDHDGSILAKKDYTTYCNPIDLDYTYMSHYRARFDVSYRSGADPAIVYFKGKYYLFVTRSHGYWISEDLSDWKFVRPQSWYFNGCNAPAAAVYGEKIILLGDPSGRGAVIESDDPDLGNWTTNFAVINVPRGVQDPCLFVDDDNRVYLYEESSNKFPIHGIELDANNWFVPIDTQVSLFNLDPENHGWERFGQDHRSELKPFIEGPWMVKHNGKYYLEYGAPGTQWNVYADGVYTADDPLGPFTYADYNPISYKPGGFLKGSGHGSTVESGSGDHWHFATMAISVNFKFERRLGMYPAGFENDGQMYVNTAYGDYPHYLPGHEKNGHKNRFTGWMLLSKDKPVSTNSALVAGKPNVVDESEEGYMQEQILDFSISNINDEEIRSYWVSESNHDSIYVIMDLEQISTINAIQINFQDYKSQQFGRPDTLCQQFVLSGSTDGENWNVIADYSENKRDIPHAYLELARPATARYLRYDHVNLTNPYLAIADWRIFGIGSGEKPTQPQNFTVSRQEDRRNADCSWDPVSGATGYMLYWGIAPDKLNLAVQIYGDNHYELRALNTQPGYYMQVEAFSENGISEKSPVVYVK